MQKDRILPAHEVSQELFGHDCITSEHELVSLRNYTDTAYVSSSHAVCRVMYLSVRRCRWCSIYWIASAEIFAVFKTCPDIICIWQRFSQLQNTPKCSCTKTWFEPIFLSCFFWDTYISLRTVFSNLAFGIRKETNVVSEIATTVLSSTQNCEIGGTKSVFWVRSWCEGFQHWWMTPGRIYVMKTIHKQILDNSQERWRKDC